MTEDGVGCLEYAEVDVVFCGGEGEDELLGEGQVGAIGRDRTHVDEIGPLGGKVELRDESDGLCDLCADVLVCGIGEGDHGGDELGTEGGLVLVGEGRDILRGSAARRGWTRGRTSSHLSFAMFLR